MDIAISHNSNSSKMFIRILERMKFNRVLDVGAGWGHNGATLRVQFNYKGMMNAIELHNPWIDGLKYSKIYDKVIHDDAKNLLNHTGYDLYILGDILEHLNYDDAIKIINGLLEMKANIVILTPNADKKKIKSRSNEHYTGNNLMKHKSGFDVDDFKGYNCILIPIHYVPWYFKPLYELRAKIKGSSAIYTEILAFRCII